jgi:hypothetical protein
MSEMPKWDGGPAIGLILVRLAELYTRALRVDVERKARGLSNMVGLLGRRGQK